MASEDPQIPEETTERSSPFSGFKNYGVVLRNRDYFYLWWGSIISNIGNRIHFIALMVYTYNLTGKALNLGLLMIIMSIPNFLLSPVMGVLADRMDKRKLIIASDVARFALVILFPFAQNIWQIYALAFLIGAANAAFFPSVFSIIPQIVPKKDLLTANSLNVTTMNVVAIIGPAAGGLIVGYWGTTPAFVINSFTFLFSAFMILLIRKPGPRETVSGELEAETPKKTSYFGEFVEGLRFMMGDPMMRYIIFTFAALVLVTSGLNPLFVVLTKEVLGKGEVAFGYLISALGVGGIVGGFLYGLIGQRFSRISIIINLLFLDSIIVIVLGINTSYYAALGLFAVFGIIGTVFSVTIMTLLQEYIPEDKMGRAMGVFSVMFDPLTMVSMGVFGYLADLIGTGLVFVGSGALELAATGFARFLPVYRKVTKLEPPVKLDERAGAR
ncbi:MAG: MFS transporter [Candidatus Coatesbacteria bacterium]|nr:MAG: MFS transporter [Candidatus Coatesbacteria bacterium]